MPAPLPPGRGRHGLYTLRFYHRSPGILPQWNFFAKIGRHLRKKAKMAPKSSATVFTALTVHDPGSQGPGSRVVMGHKQEFLRSQRAHRLQAPLRCGSSPCEGLVQGQARRGRESAGPGPGAFCRGVVPHRLVPGPGPRLRPSAAAVPPPGRVPGQSAGFPGRPGPPAAGPLEHGGHRQARRRVMRPRPALRPIQQPRSVVLRCRRGP